MSKPKFKEGDKVIYTRKTMPDVEATVTRVSVGPPDEDNKYIKPIYHIRWAPTGHAVVYANQISLRR